MANSSTVTAGSDATAAQYNNLRKDLVALSTNVATTTGSANAYLLGVDAQMSALVAGMVIIFKTNFANTGAATINLTPSGGSALGAVSLKKSFNVALESGDLPNGMYVVAIYDGTNFQIVHIGTDMTSANKATLTGGGNADSLHIHGAIPSLKLSTAYETAGRFATGTAGSGAVSFGNTGVNISTGNTSGSYASITCDIGSYSFMGDIVYGAKLLLSLATGSTYTNSSFFGLGVVTAAGTGHTYTTRHIGFKMTRTASSGAVSIYGTVGDGTTESATSQITTATNSDYVEICFKKISTTSVVFYVRVNNGSWVTSSIVTTNIPTDNTTQPLQNSVSNNSTANAGMGANIYFTNIEHSVL